MDFRTPVALPSSHPVVEATSHALFLGSCFAENTCTRMAALFPDGQVMGSPFGVLYNPESIRLALETLLGGSLFFPDDVMFEGRDGVWHSWMHATAFSSADRNVCRERILGAYAQGIEQLSRATLLCLTFGTTHAYRLRESGLIVGNCHKEPARSFVEVVLTQEQIVEKWQETLARLRKKCPTLQVVFSVSPYRYQKYGFHANALSKATLLLAIEQLCKSQPQTFYFPAYEIVTDELRDYRFYKPDMLHPSEQAADYVWERFCEWTFTAAAHKQAERLAKQRRQQAHRPLVDDAQP